MTPWATFASNGPTASLATITDDKYAMAAKMDIIRLTLKRSVTNW